MRPRILTIWAFVILIASSTAYGQAPKLRLAEVQDVNPSSYQIDLTLDPARDTFTGSIVIQLEIRKPLHTLWLNQQKITVQTTSLKAAGKTYHVRIYPAYGNSVQDGHSFGYFGSSVWGDDVFRFLEHHCGQS